MRNRTSGVTCLAAVCLLGGCASSPGVRQAKQTDPIIVVTVQSTPKKGPDKPPVAKAPDLEKALKEAEEFGLVGVLQAGNPSDGSLDGAFGSGVVGGVVGGIPGGVIGGPGDGFGGLGGIGTGIGGGGSGLVGIGSLGTESHYGMIGLLNKGSNERVKVKLGQVIVTGPLVVDVVQRQVDDHRDEFQRCYRLEQIEGTGRWGSVTIEFTIDSTGHVSDAHVYDSNLSSRELESCIAHAIGSLEFPPPGADKTALVKLPVSF